MQAQEPNLVAAELHFGVAARSEVAWLPRSKFSGFRRGTSRFPCRARRLPCRWRTRATGEMAETPIRSRCTGRRHPDGTRRTSNRCSRNQPRAVWFRRCVPHPASLRRSRMNRLGKIFSYHLRWLIRTNFFVAICSATGEIEWMQNGRFRTGSSSSGFSSTDLLKILLPSSPV